MSYDIRLEHWLPGETPVQRTLREARKAFRRRDIVEPKESPGGYWKVEMRAANHPRSKEVPPFVVLAQRVHPPGQP